MAMGWDTALIMGGISAAGAMTAAHMTNSANAAQNAFSAEQAGGFFQASQEHQRAERERAQSYNSAEALMARQAQIEESARQREWAGNQATDARNFEAYYSNTAMQRRVADLKLAGLSPMLAYQQGGASTPNASAPSGSAASLSNAAGSSGSAGNAGQVPNRIAMSPVINNSAGMVSSAIEAGMAEAKADNIKADTMQKLGQTAPTMQQAQLFERQAQDIVKKWDLIDQQIAKEAAHTSESQHRSDLIVMQQDMTAAMTELQKAQTGVAKGTVTLQAAQAAVARVEEVAKKYGLDELKASSDFWKKLDASGSGNDEVLKGIQKIAPILRMFK